MKRGATRQLEDLMIRYRDLITVPVADNGEPMVVLDPSVIASGYLPEMSDMMSILKNKIVVRASIVRMLENAQKRLKKTNKTHTLYVTYGYRSLEVQTAIFRDITSKIARERFFPDPSDLYEEVHRFIAVPTVAGHPTGGAVDVTIRDASDRRIDFGSTLYDFSSKDCYVYSGNISRQAQRNRLLLRRCMMAAGFAPFDGEWWHFSYGDREWAQYYKKPNALYAQLSVSQVKSNLLQSVL